MRLVDNVDYVEEQRRGAILRRKIRLVLEGFEPPFPDDWNSDLLAPDWEPPTPQEIEEERREMRRLSEKGRPEKPVRVPGPGEFAS